jgi:hypothetical protein
MWARQFVRTPKTITQAGNWRCGALDPKGKMGKDQFPLAKGRSFQLGNQWHWRVDHWSAGTANGRLLIAYHLGKGNYLAWASLERGPKEFAVIACLEFHGDHDGWHIHSGPAPIDEFATGCTRQRILGIRNPRKGGYHRPRRAIDGTVIDGFGMSPITAQNVAYRAFRVVIAVGTEGLFG